MTKKLFWQDPYLTNRTTKVTAVSGPETQIAESIFYAFSGGQENDQGSIERRQRRSRPHLHTS